VGGSALARLPVDSHSLSLGNRAAVVGGERREEHKDIIAAEWEEAREQSSFPPIGGYGPSPVGPTHTPHGMASPSHGL